MPAKKSTPSKSKDSDILDQIDEDLEEEIEGDVDDLYMLSDKKDLTFVSSGCTTLDLVLGGGWPMGRVSNVVGDRSAGKTLLAIEACANFDMQISEGEGQIWYNEAEAAFDEEYAASLGLPLDRVFFANGDEPKECHIDDSNHSIEGLFEHLEKVIEWHESKGITKGLYVVDSLDAFTDRAEMKRKIDEGSFGGNKPKKIGELFRKLVRRMEAVGIHLMIVSQIRDKIGVTFGETKTRSGGKALDFYASQIIWLAETGKNKKTVQGIERPVSVNVRARCKKNKVGLPFRECNYVVEFGFGIDDIHSNINFLVECKDTTWLENLDVINYKKTTLKRNLTLLKGKDDETYDKVDSQLKARVKKRWKAIEVGFMPKRKKYRK